MPLKKLGEKLRCLRENNGLLLREVAAQLGVDPSLLCKIELGDKKPTREHLTHLARIYHTDEKQLVLDFLSDKILHELGQDAFALEALKVAEEKLKYNTKTES